MSKETQAAQPVVRKKSQETILKQKLRTLRKLHDVVSNKAIDGELMIKQLDRYKDEQAKLSTEIQAAKNALVKELGLD